MASTAKTTYQITNWSQYNESLMRRGDVTFWFDEEVMPLGSTRTPNARWGVRSSTAIWRSSREDRGVEEIVPPRKNARITRHGNTSADPLPRDECLRQIRRDGRKVWKQSIGYHRRSLAETAVHRLKSCFGGSLKNRNIENQQTEVTLRCKLLNLFVTLGMPAFLWS